MKKIITLSFLASSLLVASGYRLPESSMNATALSAAYVANAQGADAAYYNPANLAFNSDNNAFEGDLTYINLAKITYTDNRSPLFNGQTKEENLFAPSFFLSSKDYDGVRYGFSLTVPGGLSKRWDNPYEKLFAQEFTLKIIELNPVASYKVNNNFAIGGGVRLIYSEGVIKSNGNDITAASGGTINKPAARDMEADTIEYGYNVAATYKPDDAITLAATYRSNVNIKEEGNAKLTLSGTKLYDGGASVEVPLPAVASVAFAYDFGSTVLELEYDKTFWSEYKTLDFQFKDSVPVALRSAFDDPKPREWKDTNAIRVGLTHQLNEKLTLLGGFAIDENPAPTENLGFELPDSDATLYSGGFRYQYSKELSFGASVLYDSKDNRKVVNDAINGEFKDASALLVTTGVSYIF